MNFDDEMIMAYVDGELDLVTAKRIEKAAAADAGLAGKIAAQHRLRARLSAHFDPVLDEPVPQRLQAPLNVVQLGPDKSAPSRFRVTQWAAMAASLAIGLMVGPQIFAPDAGPVTVEGGMLVASADLDKALTTQLASSQANDAPVRIGLTFRNDDNAICRTFEGADMSGIACRNNRAWQIRQSFSGTTAHEFRQASAGEIARAATAMMADNSGQSIADAEAEKAWQKAGWE